MADTTNSEDTLDVRDLIERLEELETEREAYGEAYTGTGDAADAWADENQDEAEELKALSSLLEEMKGYGGDHQWRGDWYPVTLIRGSYFEEYAEEFAEDVVEGYSRQSTEWPFDCIDWERAARELQQDYSEVDYDGVAYYYR